jgi:hypothetical protein
MDLFTASVADDVAERTTTRPPAAAYCRTCRGPHHAATEPCTAACHTCGTAGELRTAGGVWHCPVGHCLGAGSTPVAVEPIPSRRGRWGFHGDRTLPAFTVRLDSPLEGAGFVGRYPTIDHAQAHATMLYGDRAERIGAKATIQATPVETTRPMQHGTRLPASALKATTAA